MASKSSRKKSSPSPVTRPVPEATPTAKPTAEPEEFPTEIQPSTPVPSPAKPKSPFKRVAFPILTLLLIPVLFFLVLEGGLRAFGYGYNPSFFLTRDVNGQKVVTENHRYTRRFFPPALVRLPEVLSFPARKPEGTYRIFVFGSSAAKGEPAPPYGFSRILETLLRERHPGKTFEVINTAITAVNSNVLPPIAAEAARYDPDLFIVYEGNNEVIGPFGPATVFGPYMKSTGLIRANVALKGTRTGQWIDGQLQKVKKGEQPPKDWGGMSMFLKNGVQQDDPRMTGVYRHFEDNLKTLCRAGRKAGVMTILCTPPTNLKDCAPFSSLNADGLPEEKKREWERFRREGDRLASKKQFRAAIQSYEKAEALHGGSADLQFLLGRAYEGQGEYKEAKARYVRARDLDTLRFRTDSGLNDVIKKVAVKEKAILEDSEEILSVMSPRGILGDEMLYEHVHLNFHGNYVLARYLSRTVERLLQLPAEGERLSEAECKARLGFTDWNAYQVESMIVSRKSQPPFTRQLDHSESLRREEAKKNALKAKGGPAGYRASDAMYRQALEANPGDRVLRNEYGYFLLTEVGDPARATEQFRQVVKEVPHHFYARSNLALALSQQDKLDEAVDMYREALAVNPDFRDARVNLALTLLVQGEGDEARQLLTEEEKTTPFDLMLVQIGDDLLKAGDPDRALERYRQALAENPGRATTHQKIGAVYVRRNRPDEAMEAFREAARLEPENAEIRSNLGIVLLRAGRPEEARQSFEEALRLQPGNAAHHRQLAKALLVQKKVPEAIEQYRAALRIDPKQWKVRNDLALALVNQGDPEGAVREWRQAIRINPENFEAQRNLGMAFMMKGRPKEAAPYLSAALRINPQDASVRQALADARKSGGG